MQVIFNVRYFVPLILSIILSPGVIIAQEETGEGRDSVKVEKLFSNVKNIHSEAITGYLVQRNTDITGSVSIVDPARLTAIPAGNVSNLLQGRVTGVAVTGSGQPGVTSKVRIRGFASFLNNDPLYVVDGVPVRDISLISPNDIALLSVLKDAGAASVYGSRASNGVIVVTTRRGNRGLNLSFNLTPSIPGWTGQSEGVEYHIGTGECIQVQTGYATSPMRDHTARKSRSIRNRRKGNILRLVAGLQGIPQTGIV